MPGQSNPPAPRKEGEEGREPAPLLKQEEGTYVHHWVVAGGVCVCVRACVRACMCMCVFHIAQPDLICSSCPLHTKLGTLEVNCTVDPPFPV